MKIVERNTHLLDAPRGYYLVCPISGDMKFNSGIEKAINDTHGLKEKLIDLYGEVDPGEAYLVDNIYAFVAKSASDEEPDFEMIMDALSEIHEDMEDRSIKKLAIPKFYSDEEDADGTKWDEVLTAIKEEFEESNVNILISTLS